MKILADTWAKQDVIQARSLPDQFKHFFTTGTELPVVKLSPAPLNHYRITLQSQVSGYQTWLFYADHVDIPDVRPKEPDLKVPYYSQRDNQLDWWRTCNTSSCAMVAEFLKPGCCQGSDDWYYSNCVIAEGDTTDHAAQTRALEKLGVRSVFRYDLDYPDLDAQLAAGKPVVIGVLHRGTLQNPTGGHMIVVIGKYEDGYICHDPWGEGFDYSNLNGRAVRYPYRSLDARWLANQPGSGWGRIFL